MPYLGGGLSGAAGGAGIGFTVAGPLGAGIGAGLGFLSGLFGKSPDEERADRRQETLLALRQARREALSEGLGTIMQQINASKAAAGQGAARRAAAMGRMNSTESLVRPAEGAVAAQGANVVGNFVTGTNRQYNSMEQSVNLDFQNRPIEPGTGDYLSAIGTAAAQFKLNQDYTKGLTPKLAGEADPFTVGQGPELGEGLALASPMSTLRSRNMSTITPLSTGLPTDRSLGDFSRPYSRYGGW